MVERMPLVETRTTPITQSIDSVKALLSWRKMPTNPMPDFIELPGQLFLVLSGKKDVYYTTTKRACSCPSQAYNPGQSCKHQKKFFPEVDKANRPEAKAPKVSPLASLIDLHDTLPGEVSYWQKKEQEA